MIRLATIGTNFITDWFMEGVQELEEIKLTAVYSRNLEKGKQFAAKYGVEKVYNNYEEMAQDPEIDAVYVASPTYMHYAHSITMINFMLDDLRRPAGIFSVLWFKILIQIIYFDLLISGTVSGSVE